LTSLFMPMPNRRTARLTPRSVADCQHGGPQCDFDIVVGDESTTSCNAAPSHRLSPFSIAWCKAYALSTIS
jgi:hypothetical protein